MNVKKKRKILTLSAIAFLILYSSVSIYAGEVFELDGEPGENDTRIISALNRMTFDRVVSDKNTKGFSARYVSKWYSPLSVDVYVLGLAKREKMSLVRVESQKKGAEKVFRNFLLEELTKKEITGGLTIIKGPDGLLDPKSEYSYKSYLWSESLALIQPAASVYYNSSKSPVYGGTDTLKGMFGYIVMDLLLAGLGYYYATTTMEKNSNLDKLFFKPARSGNVLDSPGADVFIGLLMLPRIYRMIGGWQDTYTHNRILEISASKSF
ncbi:hypothetical protein EHQ27_04375 [Leptospira wolffii]|uniref:hypothetical protein n=1 Tax=Leptospira wolffii TaxID=409998 RepID=UPI0003466EC2|nr:hypothetical protein [Leptospira wolffii]TGK61743.1 hypothetical protein EHQ32_02505 [Leptospira wolffii]TGK70286.1 hypothetical protein EHQ35_17920 [Leptospira wolffii]TGK77209.1 hypothetical protein EHQ27_04375 [Leptospira wolffii]TGL30938.1 hypothetical protein EHQ57_05890 [Leptospira wolffii]